VKNFIVSLHDAHPQSHSLIEEQVQYLSDWGVKNTSILVVPEFHHGKTVESDPHFINWVTTRQSVGDDIVLHGYYHDRVGLPESSYYWTKIYSNNEAEFYNLAVKQAQERWQRGLNLWHRFGWKANGFIAPGWLMENEHDWELKALGFSYTVRLKSIHALQTGSLTKTQSLCFSTRASWRVASSLVWNRYLYQKLLHNNVARLSLHPNDLRFPSVKRLVECLVKGFLDKGYTPKTYADYVTS
jgi:uncharacterized protein